MKKRNVTSLIAISIALLASACGSRVKAKNQAAEKASNDTEKAIELTYKQYGGMLGLQETLTITQDSILYSYLIYSGVADIYDSRQQSEPTLPEVWARLMEEFDLATFIKIKDGGSFLEVDGTDIQLTIATSLGIEYSFVNGEEDKHYRKLQPFFQQADSIVDSFRAKTLPQTNPE